MAHDDMHMLIYKMLAYLYDCIKKGLAPTPPFSNTAGWCSGRSRTATDAR